MIADCHIHSSYSIDACDSIIDVCRAALDRSLSVIAITDHLDMDPDDPFHSIVDFDRQAADIDLARQQFAGQLTICWGVEVSYDERLFPEIKQIVSRHPFDIVLGSVHRIAGRDFSLEDDMHHIKAQADTMCKAYFATVAAAAHCGLFDVIAHFDLPKRYGVLHWNWDWQLFRQDIRRALQAIIDRGLALEINVSGYDQNPGEPYPCLNILKEYRNMGGSMVTYGSDSHRQQDVGRYHHQARQLITELNLTPVYFRVRTCQK